MSRRPAFDLGIVGRDTEIADLAHRIDRDDAVVVLGEPGIGKTTIARAAIAAAGRRRLEGGGFATLGWMPLMPLERAIGQTLGGLDDGAVASAVMREVGSGVLFIDDLQWADARTLATVARLAGRIGLVVALRTGDPSTDQVLEALAGIERASLDALPAEAARQLLERHRPSADPASAARLIERAGGNPLLLEELGRSQGDDASLASIVRSRLFTLRPGTREAMLMLALAGRPLTADTVGHAADALVDAGLARRDADGRLRVRHDLLGEAVIDGTSAADRVAMHARLAERADSPGDAARHHLAAGNRSAARRLALEAATGATGPVERSRHLAIAAEAADGPEALDLRFDAAEAAIEAYEPTLAVRLLKQAMNTRLTPRQALIMARVLATTGDLDAVRTAATRGLESIVPGDRSTVDVEVELHVEMARAAVSLLGDTTEMLALATEADALARRHGVRQASARAILGAARCQALDARGLDDLRTAVDDAFAEHDAVTAFTAASLLIYELLKDGLVDEGLHIAQRLRARARALGLPGRERAMTAWTMGFGFHLGHLRETLELGEALELEDPLAENDWYVAQALIDLGRFDEARVRVDRFVAGARPGEYSLGVALWLQAELELWSGRFVQALAAADRHAREIPDAQHRIFVEVAGAWAAFELGRGPVWRHVVADRAMGVGGGVELEALTMLANGDAEHAASWFEDAADLWAGRHVRGELRCRWAAGEALRRAGRRDEAVATLTALEQRLTTAGAAAILARVHRSLRLLGIRRAVRPTAATNSPLTVREQEILRLVAAGLPDREIAARLGLSRWTVLRAVGSATAKLGATTRAAAVAAMT